MYAKKIIIALLIAVIMVNVMPQAAYAREGSTAALADDVTWLINNEREEGGYMPLRIDPELTRAAQIRVREIVRVFSHSRPNGQFFNSVITETAAFDRLGENIAMRQITSRQVVREWMASPPHQANIMNNAWNVTGVAVYERDGIIYWVQLFGRTAGADQALSPTQRYDQNSAANLGNGTQLQRATSGSEGGEQAQTALPVLPQNNNDSMGAAGTQEQAPAQTIPGTPPGQALDVPSIPVLVQVVPDMSVLTEANAQASVQHAVNSAAPDAVPTIRVVDNSHVISAYTMRAVADAAENHAVRISADTAVPSGAVDVRVTVINPALATRDVILAGSTASNSARYVHRIFERHFGGDMTVISLDQQGDFGMNVRIAARIDESLDLDSLLFYSYNRQTNRFRRFTPESISMDGNGFLHFTTAYAGDIVITNTLI